jgi:CRISPR/Cas system-associated exonuclease Cas4 (RecB family)
MSYFDDKAVSPANEISVSPSELATWNDCQRKWHFRYDQRIEPIDLSKPAPLASGVAVHSVVETICRDFPNQIPEPGDIKLRAQDSLEEQFANNYEPEKQVTKYLPGVIRAINKIPNWVWESHWFVERDISATFGDVELHGRPDMYRLVDGLDTGYEVDRVEIIDVKTTQTEPLDFLLWSPQLRYYAAVLQQEYRDRVISYKYLCLPTQGTGAPPHSPAWIFTPAMFKATSEEIAGMSARFNRSLMEPRYTRACSFCDYNLICKGIITGADAKGIIQELYQERQPHD